MDTKDLVLAIAIWVAALVGLFLIVFGVFGTSFFGGGAFDNWQVPAGIALCVIAALLVWMGRVRTRAQSRERIGAG